MDISYLLLGPPLMALALWGAVKCFYYGIRGLATRKIEWSNQKGEFSLLGWEAIVIALMLLVVGSLAGVGFVGIILTLLQQIKS